MKHLLAAAFVVLGSAGMAWAGEPQVYFVAPQDGASVASPVTVIFGLRGMGVAPAGVERDGTGHHHVLLNRPAWGEGPDDAAIAAEGIPADDNHIHFGGGQTETTLELPPGTHTLQLLLGDHVHVPHAMPLVSQKITITVTE